MLLLVAGQQTPLTIGETFTLPSRVLNETRTINVYRPSPYGLAADAALPVLYMPDGGIQEDFLHVAGLVQVLSGNGTMRPFLVVGIENTERRRRARCRAEGAEEDAVYGQQRGWRPRRRREAIRTTARDACGAGVDTRGDGGRDARHDLSPRGAPRVPAGVQAGRAQVKG